MATGSARDYQNAGTPGELLALSSRRDRVARANARDCQRTGERKPGNVAPWPGDASQNAGSVAPWPRCRRNAGDALGTAGAIVQALRREAGRLGGWLALLSRRCAGKRAARDCWRYRPSVTAWPWGSCRRELLALSSRRGRVARENASRGTQRLPENQRTKAGKLPPWGVGRIITANASQRTPKLQGPPGNAARERRRRPGDGWRYCPSVTAWPGETPETAREPANASRETLRPGRASARTPGTAGAIVQA
jgi:hypothetical protein